ncbi:MAG: phosphotransferase [Gammaproteobacteria bacterium]|nr:phosphotransferase [Gammaproteobacteria bacterium]MCY4322545.1 phosphotransferase [Gammaproteobacteria bacterium]
MRDILQNTLASVLVREVPLVQGLVSMQRLSGGASQETYKLIVETPEGQHNLCLRRSPGGEAIEDGERRPGLATEAALMCAARDAGVPEPDVHYVLQEEDGLGEGFVMQWVDGETLGRRIVAAPEFANARAHLIEQCSAVLARIHAINLDAGGLRKRLTELPPEAFVSQTYARYLDFGFAQPMIDYAARWLLENLPANSRRTLVHNDFRIGNLMVDADGLCAVLDWELAHIGDPVRDLGWLCSRSWRFGGALPAGGIGTREALLAAYAKASGHVVSHAHLKFWEVFGSFWWAVACLGMAEHYRTGPDKTVERPAIGRRTSECQADCVNLLFPGPVDLPDANVSNTGLDMPEGTELLQSVHDFLRSEVRRETSGRTRFLSLVASNSLAILLRESSLLAQHRSDEQARLWALLGVNADLAQLRGQLCTALRRGEMPLDDARLQSHLRQTVMLQLCIDQPKYPALKGPE